MSGAVRAGRAGAVVCLLLGAVLGCGADRPAATPPLPNEIPVTETPVSIAIAPDGTKAYVVQSGSNDSSTISVIDTATRQLIASIPIPALPTSITLTPDGRTAYVSGFLDNTIRVIDLVTNTATGVVSGESLAGGAIAIDPSGTKGFIADVGLFGLRMLDPATNSAPFLWIPVLDWRPEILALTKDGSVLYATSEGCNVVAVDVRTPPRPPDEIGFRDDAVLTFIGVSCQPTDIEVTPDGRRALVVNYVGTAIPGSSISRIDTATHTRVGREIDIGLPPGEHALALAFTPDGREIYLSHWNRDRKRGAVSVLPASRFLDVPE